MKNLGQIKDPKDIANKEYVDNYVNEKLQGENTILADNSFSAGFNNIAGGKAFKIIAEPTGTVGGTGTYKLDSVTGIQVGMTYSAVTSIAAYHQGTIQSVNSANNTVTVDNYAGYALNTNTDDPDNYNFYNTFLLDDYPELGTITIGYNASAFGQGVNAHNVATHAEGKDTKALGKFSHAEGLDTIAGHGSHAEGAHTKALGAATHAEGDSTISDGHYSHTEGYKSQSSGQSSHAEGENTKASGKAAHSEGENTEATGVNAHSEGFATKASGNYSHSEGYQSKSSGFVSHAEGCRTESSGEYSHSQGNDTIAQGNKSHAEGQNTFASGENSHAEGLGSNTRSGSVVTAGTTGALGKNSHSEGNKTTASGNDSHAEGQATTASGLASHAEGVNSLAQGAFSHAEGNATQALGALCHTEGENTIAREGIKYAHVEGQGTIAGSSYQHIQGKYNIEDTSGNLVHIVGYGTSSTPKNIHTIDKNGNAWFAGDVTSKDGKLLSESDIYEERTFGWTEFDYTYHSLWEDVPEQDNGSISDNCITAVYAIYTIHCADSILGFEFSNDNSGTNNYIEINGTQYFEDNVSIPLTYMNQDIIVYCDMNGFTFSNMIKKSIKILDNVYTKAETDIAIANAPHLKRAIVTELPATGDTNTIYMVGNSTETISYNFTTNEQFDSTNHGIVEHVNNNAYLRVYANGTLVLEGVATTEDDGLTYTLSNGEWNLMISSISEYATLINSSTSIDTFSISIGELNTNIYLEYMYINDSWEQIGSSEVDLTDYVKNDEYATYNTGGVVRNGGSGWGISVRDDGIIFVCQATDAEINDKSSPYKPITPNNLDYAVKSIGDGYYATEAEVGKIDTALTSIITIQNELIGGEA